MSANLTNNKVFTSNDLTNKVVMNINVVFPLMEHLIFCEKNGTLAIIKDYGGLQISPSKPLNQIASLQAFVIAIYYALVVDNVIVVRKMVFQRIAQAPIMNTYLVRGLLLSRSLTKLKTNVPNNIISCPPKCKQTLKES